MPTNWETFPIKFEGGLRTDLGRLDQGMQFPGTATSLVNFEPSIRGGYQRIEGFNKFDPADVDPLQTNPVKGVIVVDEVRALARKGGSYYLSSGSGWTNKGTVGTTGALKINFDFFNFDGTNKIVIVDGVEDPAFYNTDTNTLTFDTAAPTNATGSYLVKVFKNHIFFANGNLLTFTAPYEETNYDTGDGAGQINIGADITGLVVFREQLIIFTTNSISRITGNTSSDFVLQPIADNTGCLCPYTIQEVGGDILYLGPDGVRWLSATAKNNDFGLDRASANIQDEILDIISLNCNYSSIVLRSKNQYRLFAYVQSTPKSLSNGFIATKYSEQDVSNIAWSQTRGIKVYSANSRQFRDREVVLFTSDDGYVYRMESGNRLDTLPIPFSFETPYMPITDPRVRKTMYKHSLYIKSQGVIDLTCRLKLDYAPSGSIQPAPFNLNGGSAVSIYGQAVYGTGIYSSVVADTFVNQTVGSGFVVALRYDGESTTPPFILNHAILEFSVNERR
jgi:hypothetical protein